MDLQNMDLKGGSLQISTEVIGNFFIKPLE